MATINQFEDIKAWQKARVLCKNIFVELLDKSYIRDYKLKDQINAASGSIMDNIAEGFGRGGTKEFVHFLSIAKASAYEVKSQLYRAKDRNYLSETTFQDLIKQVNEINGLIAGLIRYLKKTNLKGQKFK